MPVLVEGISVILRVGATEEKYPDRWEGFVRDSPNNSLYADGDLARVGFMSPQDTKRFVSSLASHGLTYLDDGEAVDLVVADQQRGVAAPCNRAEHVVACRAAGSAGVSPPRGRAGFLSGQGDRRGSIYRADVQG